MPTALAAIEVANALLALSLNTIQAAQKIQATLALAQSQNRDLTDDELNTVIAARHAAEGALISHLTKGTAKPAT